MHYMIERDNGSTYEAMPVEAMRESIAGELGLDDGTLPLWIGAMLWGQVTIAEQIKLLRQELATRG